MILLICLHDVCALEQVFPLTCKNHWAPNQAIASNLMATMRDSAISKAGLLEIYKPLSSCPWVLCSFANLSFNHNVPAMVLQSKALVGVHAVPLAPSSFSLAEGSLGIIGYKCCLKCHSIASKGTSVLESEQLVPPLAFCFSIAKGLKNKTYHVLCRD